jgi:hypothetical protein
LYDVIVQNNGPDLSAGRFLKIQTLNVDGAVDQELWFELTDPLARGGQMRFRLGHYQGEGVIGSIRIDAVNSDGSVIAELNTSNNIHTFPPRDDPPIESMGGEE